MNIPARTELGKRVRACFMAEEGKRLIACDLSQIELRILAHVSEDARLLDAFMRGVDIHLATAAIMLGKPESMVTKDERSGAKSVNFGIGYGETERGLQLDFALKGVEKTLAECVQFIDDWFNAFPGARRYMELQHERARRYGFVWDMFGRCRCVPEVRSVHRQVVEGGLRQAGNMPIQATAAGVLKYGMAKLVRWDLHKAVPLLPVHDELLWEVPEENAEWYGEVVQLGMERAVEMSVPVVAEWNVNERWVKE